MGITTEIGTTTPHAIHVRGLDLCSDILGHFDFVDMICSFAAMKASPMGTAPSV